MKNTNNDRMIYPDDDLTTVGVKVTSYISPPHQSEYDGQGHSKC